MRKISLAAISVMLFCYGSAQTDSIQYEIQNSARSKSVLILKGRNLLLDNFLSGDIAKVAEIENYLTDKLSNEDYIALYPVEQWLIKFWTKDYDKLIQSVKQYDSIYPSLQKKVHPQEDDLYMKLKEKSYKQKLTMVNSINNSSLTQQDKDFLILHFYSCLLSTNSKDITQDTLNYLSDNFIRKYPGNGLIEFTRKYIRYKLIPSKWGFTFEFFSGYGIFTGNLRTHYSDNIPFGVAFDIYYKRYVLYLRDYIGFSHTNHDFTDKNEVWTKNSQVRVYLPEASLGFIIHDGRRFKLAPFIGISSTDISPTENDLTEKPALKDYELPFTTTFTVGFNVDLKFGKAGGTMSTNRFEQSYLFMRIRYAYNFPQFSKSYNGFGGNMQYITIGLGGFNRKIKPEF